DPVGCNTRRVEVCRLNSGQVLAGAAQTPVQRGTSEPLSWLEIWSFVLRRRSVSLRLFGRRTEPNGWIIAAKENPGLRQSGAESEPKFSSASLVMPRGQTARYAEFRSDRKRRTCAFPCSRSHRDYWCDGSSASAGNNCQTVPDRMRKAA